MRLLEIGVETTLRIPNAWTAFTFGGWVYRLRIDREGRPVWAKVADENTSILRVKRA